MSVIMTMFILMLFTVISIVVFVAGVLLRLKRGVRDTFRRNFNPTCAARRQGVRR